MPIALGPEKQEEIYEQIKQAFSDFALFDKLVAVQLRKAINDTNTVEIDMKTTRKVTDRYFDTNLFQTEQQKVLLKQITLILQTTYVLILSQTEEAQKLMYHSVKEFLSHYPQFMSEEDEEITYLFKFRNYLKVALLIIPARLNKQQLVKIAARLEGSGVEYITGGGQKPCVTRRCDIYEREGNVVKVNKPKNKTNVQTAVMNQQAALIGGQSNSGVHHQNITGKKRANNHASLRDVKLIRLSSEEIRHLAQGPTDPFSSSAAQPPLPPSSSSSSLTPMDIPNNSYQSNNIFQSQRNLNVMVNPVEEANSYPLQPQLSELTTLSQYSLPLIHTNTEPSYSSLVEAAKYISDLNYDQDAEVFQSIDELLDIKKSDTIIDPHNLTAPTGSSLAYQGSHGNIPNNNVIIYSQSALVSSQDGGVQFSAAGTLGNVSLSASFPPTLQREHSDILDRLFYENTELWNQLAPPSSEMNVEGNEPNMESFDNNNGMLLRQQSTEGYAENASVTGSVSAYIPPPIQMVRAVSWDVYNGNFTEDLQFYLLSNNNSLTS